MAKVCIICEKEQGGAAYPVKDDVVIRSIRWVKQKLGVARNNELYVCEPCLPQYTTKRKAFEKRLVFSAAIALVIIILINGVQLLYGKFNLAALPLSIFVGLIIVGLAVLTSYTPPIAGPGNAPAAPAAAIQPAPKPWKTAPGKEPAKPKARK